MSMSCSHVLNLTPAWRLVDRPPKYRPEAFFGRGCESAPRPQAVRSADCAGLSGRPSGCLIADACLGHHRHDRHGLGGRKNSLAMPGSQDVLKDAFGKYLVVYVDAGGSVSVVYANSDPTQAGAWSPPSKSPIPVAAYRDRKSTR